MKALIEVGAYVLLLAGAVAALLWAATAPVSPRVYPAAQDLLQRTPDATVLAPPVSKVTSHFAEEVLRLHHEVGGEMQD